MHICVETFQKTDYELGPIKIVTAANNACADDMASLRMDGIAYLCKDPSSQVSLPITKEQGKTVRGFNHPTTARLLCLMRHLKDFDRDLE